VDEVVLVTTDEICAAIKDIYRNHPFVMELSGGLALADYQTLCQSRKIDGQNLRVAICCGANMNFDRLRFFVMNISK
jgi:threonine dehydratase